MVCLFCYRALHDLPYTVYEGYARVFMYIDDFLPTLANVVDNFVPGEVYNIAGSELHDMKRVSDIILGYLGKDDSLVEYHDTEEATALEKNVDVSKAVRDLGHQSTVALEDGIPQTINWQKEVYGCD